MLTIVYTGHDTVVAQISRKNRQQQNKYMQQNAHKIKAGTYFP